MHIIQGEGGAYKAIRLHAVENDRKLSWKAVGLLTYLVSRPPGWEISRDDLERRHTDAEASVRSAKGELIKAGYLRILGPRSVKGTFTKGFWVVVEFPLKTEKEWRELLKKLELDGPLNLRSI